MKLHFAWKPGANDPATPLDDPEGYYIYYRKPGAQYTPQQRLMAPGTATTLDADLDVVAGMAFVVRAFRGADETLPSNEVTLALVAAPTQLTVNLVLTAVVPLSQPPS